MPATQQTDNLGSINDLTCDLIEKAKAIIQSEHNWIKEDNAQDDDDESCEVNDERACSWCFYGALCYASGDYMPMTFGHALKAISQQIVKDYPDDDNSNPASIIIDWNDKDERTHNDVIAVMDATLARRHPIAQ